MLNIIRVTFFYKVLFANVYEKTKLKIVKYNKNLKNKIDININNYKYFTGKYIIYENEQK